MRVTSESARAAYDDEDAQLVERLAHGNHAAFEALMRRHNGRLFRVARAILRDDSEAEDALQEAYLDAYRHIADFRGDARVSTWLTRIVVNRALMRMRSQKRDRVLVPFHRAPTPEGDVPDIDPVDERAESADDAAIRAELRRMVERRLDELPVAFRTVFVMRDIEEMSVQETAECLSIPTATVRTRLFRARALMRDALTRDLGVATDGVFAFAGARCDRIVSLCCRPSHRPIA